MSNIFIEVQGIGLTKTIAVDDISTIIKAGDNQTYIDMKTPLAGMPGSTSRVTVDEPYAKLIARLSELGVTIA